MDKTLGAKYMQMIDVKNFLRKPQFIRTFIFNCCWPCSV
ncbi:unnamed protein product [Larinioides sclopetarius]|uniref:Uncharacterized protein n=1 Tax=Larinioides sclopetarius TaxID=280406 RepID=A0AAV2B7D6_9ARAC